jgi:ketosteroid isomerase-like protein
MSTTGAWCLLSLVALAGVPPAAAQDTNAEVSKAILAMENQWLEAEKTNSADVVAPLLADKYLATETSGKLEDKAKTLDEVRTRKLKSAEYEDVQVAVFGHTVIVRGGYRASGTESDGTAFHEHLRWTDTWVKMPDGKWQCVATQYTAI